MRYLSRGILDYLHLLGLADDRLERLAEIVWYHVLAVGFSPTYLATNQAGIQLDWPRIPFPMPDSDDEASAAESRSLLLESATLGELVAEQLDVQTDEKIPTDGQSFHGLSSLTSSDKPDRMAMDSIFPIALTANWGYEKIRHKESGQGSSRNVMPGTGRLYRRNYEPGERREIEDWGLSLGLYAGTVYAALGCETCDIFLDHDAYWRNIPANVWEYRIGGYPVLKKWLSYREHSILRRELRPDEIRFFSQLVWRLANLRLLESRLDSSFARIRDYGGDPTKPVSKKP